jgi:predicted  nucleic acid-binding Zn-ribbon protein
MKKLEKARLEKNHLQSDLFIGQIDHMAELIDRPRLQIKEQQMAIIAKDQHINNLNKAIVAKDQHIANLERFIRNLTMEIVKIKKYSVFYNLLSRFRRELLKVFGKSKE